MDDAKMAAELAAKQKTMDDMRRAASGVNVATRPGDDDERRMSIEVKMEERNGEQTMRVRVKDAIKVTASAVAATSLAMLAM